MAHCDTTGNPSDPTKCQPVWASRRTTSLVYMFVLYSLMLVCMFNLPDAPICNFAIRCKGCGESVPAPVETMPGSWIIAECPLCGERRLYLPADIFRGRLSYRLTRKPVRSETRAL